MDLHQTAVDIREAMVGLGVHLRQDWIKHCLQASGERRRQQSEAQEGVYRTFLACDLREAGEACLPAGIAGMVKQRVRGKMVVQVENATDIAKNFEQREKTDGSSPHHTLKLALGDGRQTVAAFEYRRIQGLVADPAPGLKLLLVEPWVRRGILLLSSENTTVLGGEVSSLVEARDTARAGGASSAAGPAANPAGSTQQQQNRTQPEHGSSNGAHGNNGSRAPPTPRNASTAASQMNSGSSSRTSDSPRRRRQNENPDPDDAVVDLSSGSSLSFQPRSPREKGNGQARVGAGGVVSNPYTRVTQPPGPAPRPAEMERVGEASTNERQKGKAGEAGEKESRGPPRGREARVPAFPEVDDDGPEPPDEVEQPGQNRGGGESQGMRGDRPLVSPSPRPTSAGDFGRGSGGEGGTRRGEGIGVPPRKRGCSSIGSKGKRVGARAGGRPNDLHDEPASSSSLPNSPFTSLEDLGRLAAVGGGVFRVKAVVSDARNCKIRKKKYLLVVEIEDGTAVASVRLCDEITRGLFGVEAREFKKLFQADPDLASDIQRRVEKEIREMEGVMEIDISAAASSASQQSPAAAGTPSTAMSQSSTTGDSEWLLPVVMSVKPPTDSDCRELLARVKSSLSL
ncbi:unnamed protein product [Scytosiphon promiscuus]